MRALLVTVLCLAAVQAALAQTEESRPGSENFFKISRKLQLPTFDQAKRQAIATQWQYQPQANFNPDFRLGSRLAKMDSGFVPTHAFRPVGRKFTLTPKTFGEAKATTSQILKLFKSR